jgi:putative FmdB family regulatory protein
MPTYEYVCEGCGCEFERFESITAKPLRRCPKCGKKKVKRLIGTGAGIIFKGSGFYQTDYRSESYKKGAQSETAGTAGAKKGSDKDTTKKDSKAEGKESKPEAKAEPTAKDKKKTP